jgi:acyl carrier protein
VDKTTVNMTMDMQMQKGIREAVFAALDEVNEQLPAERRLAKAETTPLAGADGHLDSLGVVNLIAAVEQQVERRFGTVVDLLDRGVLDEAEPLRTVHGLTTFLASVLSERAHA